MVQMVVHVKKGGEVMNKNKFVSVMKLHGDTQESLAEAIGLSVQRMNAKINSTGGAEFTMSEIRAIKIRYAEGGKHHQESASLAVTAATALVS